MMEICCLCDGYHSIECAYCYRYQDLDLASKVTTHPRPWNAPEMCHDEHWYEQRAKFYHRVSVLIAILTETSACCVCDADQAT